MTRRATAVLFATLAIAGCSTSDGSVQVLNGFDIPVVVTLISDSDGETTLQVPPRGRVTTEIGGRGRVKVATESGTAISDDEVAFGKKDRSKGCYRVINVAGAAAIATDDVVYGDGFGTPHGSLQSGWISEEHCYIGWAFEEPPEAISVEKHGPHGRNITWLHYVGDGSWVTAVGLLLDDKGEHASLSRGMAQRIVKVVVAHDPSNTSLPAIEQRFAAEKLAFPK